MPITIKIKPLMDQYKDYAKAGNAFYNQARPAIAEGNIVVFDMEGQLAVTTMFFNMSFAPLMDNFGQEKVKQSLRFKNLPPSQMERIRRYFADYSEVYLK